MTADQPTDLRPFTVEELCALLGVNRKTIYAMVQRDTIPGVIHLGRHLRFARAAVVTWLQEGHGPSRTRRNR